MCRPAVWEQILRESTGSTATSRNRWNESRFLEWEIPLPPLADQRRMIDLVASIDRAKLAAEGEEDAAWKAVSSLLHTHIPGPGLTGATVDSLVTLDIGGVWGSEPGVEPCDVSVYRSTEFAKDGWAEPSTAATRSVSPSQLRSRSVVAGDILLEKSGGTPTRPVGRAVRCREPISPTVVSNFVQLLRPDQSIVEPAYLFWALRSWHERGVPSQYQTATTNIRNLRTREYLNLKIELPSWGEQRAISAAADAIQDMAIGAARVSGALARLRSLVLTELLAGGRQISASYDRFLDNAA
jgi:hypothetical protein